MLSKVFQVIRVSQKPTYGMSVRRLFYDFVYRDDKSSNFYKVATQDPKLALSKERSLIEKDQEHVYQVSKLANGVTVLTESASAPSRVDVGVLLDVGTRDETNETSGSLLSMKNTYYKTVMNTNETINYGIIQMSGGDFEMDYSQESAFYRAHCLSHDVVDVFRTVVDCALEPRSVVAANVAIEKNKGTFNLEGVVQSGEDFNESVFKTAYGLSGLGMPLRGYKSNISNLTAFTLQKFQQSNIVPQRVIVCAAGVENHQEFVELAKETLSFVAPYTGSPVERVASKYVGGELRTLTDSNELTQALLFQSVNWTDNNVAVFQVANTLLSQFRLQKNIINQKFYADFAECVNLTFTDNGLFGVKFGGAADQGTQLLNDVVNQLKQLTQPINNDELERAKQLLKTNIFLALERQADRIEEAANNLRVFKEVRLGQYAQAIDSVTSEQINSAVVNVLSQNPTFVAQGGLANRLPTYDQLRNSLKL